MQNLSSYPNRRSSKYPSEIIKTEITDLHHKPQLPRHISGLEIHSHRSGYMGTVDCLPKACRLDTNKQTNDSVAFDILKYQLSDRTSYQKHEENVRSNLQHRLQVAKAQGNSQLINILQDEYKQLETSGVRLK